MHQQEKVLNSTDYEFLPIEYLLNSAVFLSALTNLPLLTLTDTHVCISVSLSTCMNCQCINLEVGSIKRLQVHD